MSANKFTESLTRENAAVVFVDHQVGLYSGVRDIALAELKHNVVALAKAARVLKLPLVVTTTAARSMWGPTIPELAEVLPPDLEIIDRSTVNAWGEPRVKAAIQATKRKKLIITGISTEVCLAFPAISATAEGYDAYAAIDASGAFWQAKREAGPLRRYLWPRSPQHSRRNDGVPLRICRSVWSSSPFFKLTRLEPLLKRRLQQEGDF